MNKKQANQGQLRARAHPTRPREPRLCIFCLSNKNPFTAPEHILSEALGNKRLILPPGVVCDPCNHGPLSGLDKALVEFAPLQLIRVLWSLQRKKGGYAKARFSNGTIIGHAGNNIQVESAIDDFLVETGPGQLQFNLAMNDLTGRKLQRVSRALLKMALECAYLDHGYRNVVGSRWNRLREAVFDQAHRGYLVLPEQVTPVGGPLQMSYMPSDDANEMMLSARLEAYGMAIGTVLGHELPSAHVLGLGHVLSFPEPKKTPTLTLHLGVTYGGKRSFRLDSDETPPFLARP
jgi:hypothetical protein